jgi:hypothetical protein
MSNVNTDGLPPEMQERIAQIIEGAKQKAQAATQPSPSFADSPHQAAIAQPQAAAPAPRQPNLMDHTIALRQEVASLSQQVAAMGQVTEAVGQAVGQLYAMFQSQTTPTDSGATYSQAFQEQVREDDY